MDARIRATRWVSRAKPIIIIIIISTIVTVIAIITADG